MGGGTLQLVAYGGQDIHIIGNPELSFFKSVYRRHTNFAMECIKQTMLGGVNTEAFKASFKLGRDGDLINKMHLQIKLPEQKNLLLTTAPTEVGNISFTLGINILSHINITNPGNEYIYGADVELEGSNVAEIRAYATINSDNKIKSIIVENRITNSFEEGTSIKVNIIGRPNPALTTGDNDYDNSLPKYGSGATAVAVRSPCGALGEPEIVEGLGKLYREPIIELSTAIPTKAPLFEVITEKQNGSVIRIKIINSGEFPSSFDEGDPIDIVIKENYTRKPSILTELSQNQSPITDEDISKRKNAWISYQNHPAYCYIKDIELKIGEQSIDKHTGQYYDIHDEFYTSNDNNIFNINYITGKNDSFSEWPPKDKYSPVNEKTRVPREIDMYVPLKFWFTKDTGQALPMIALQYHDVTIDINFRSLKSILIWNAGELAVSKSNGGVNNITTRHLEFNDFEINRINERKLIDPKIELWANYIYLDTDERKRFAKNGHEYLIEQVQIIKDRYKKVVDIPFNHSVKTLFWAIQSIESSKESNNFRNIRHEISTDTISNNWQNRKLYKPPNPSSEGDASDSPSFRHTARPYSIPGGTGEITDEDWITKYDSPENTGDAYVYDYTTESNYSKGFTQNNNYLFYGIHEDNINKSYINYSEQSEHFDRCKIIMNGIDRFSFKKSTYFRTIQPYESGLRIPLKPIHMYSFCLDPKKHQPTGTCNFSKLDSAQLIFEGENNFSNYNIYVYAQNYNILRIMEGMGGLLYNS
jgi:hypothetical protein